MRKATGIGSNLHTTTAASQSPAPPPVDIPLVSEGATKVRKSLVPPEPTKLSLMSRWVQFTKRRKNGDLHFDPVKLLNQIKTLAPPKNTPTLDLVKGKDALCNAAQVGVASTPATHTTYLANGVILKRVYDASSSLSIDQQCGSVAYWSGKSNQVGNQLSNYWQSNGQHKLLKSTTLYVYPDGGGIPFPYNHYAYVISSNGSKNSDMYVRKSHSDAVISHEFGHVFHNWTSFLNEPTKPYYSYLTNWWARQVTNPPVSYDTSKSQADQQWPWNTVNPVERFADAGSVPYSGVKAGKGS